LVQKTGLTSDLLKVRSVANYQFGHGVGEILFPDNVTITHSRSTGRVRLVRLDRNLLATLRPTDGLLALTVPGARRVAEAIRPPHLRVVVRDDVREVIVGGGNVFAKHVISADQTIRPGDEVIVTDGSDMVVAVGKALLTGKEMLAFKRGVAVKTRRGAAEGRA